jgi:membrane protease YdiL (CAAX protease family)
MNENTMLAGTLSNKQKALGYILLFPSNLYYIPIIIQFFLIWYSTAISSIGLSVMVVYLNFFTGIISLIMTFVFFKTFLLANIKAMRETIIEDTIWSCTIGFGIVYALAIVSRIMVMALLAIFGQKQLDSSNQQLVVQLLTDMPLIMALQTVIIAPILEEILYRGLLFRTFYDYHKNGAHIISAFLFGFAHIYSGLFRGDLTQIIHIIPYMIMGLAFSYAYEKRGNLYVPILMHMLVNLIATLGALLL